MKRAYHNVLKPLLILAIVVLGSAAIYTELEEYLRPLPSKVLTYPQYRDSIVKVLDLDRDGGGTGFVTLLPSGKKVIVTNGHVCEHASEQGKMRVILNRPMHGISYVISSVISIATLGDLCILKSPDLLPALTLDVLNAKVGDSVLALGHPRLGPLTPSPGNVLAYDVTEMLMFLIFDDISLARCNAPDMKIKSVMTFFGPINACIKQYYSGVSSAYIYPGSSGSPVLSSSGEVVGVMFAADSSTNYGIFIPVSILREFLKGK